MGWLSGTALLPRRIGTASQPLLTEDVVFRNPAAIEPYHGKDTMVAILRAVFGVMQDFTYLRHFGSETGYVLEFSARVGEDIVFGVDLVEFNLLPSSASVAPITGRCGLN